MDSVANDKPLAEQTEKNSSFVHPLVYVGTYSSADADSIFIYRLNSTTGELAPVHAVKGGPNPSYFAFDNLKKNLYAVNEETDGGFVSSFAVDQKSGNLTYLNKQPCFGAACHITLDIGNKYAFVANYLGGSVQVFPIQTDGTIGSETDKVQHHGSSVRADRQDKAHAHYIAPDNEHRRLLVVDLGIDKLLTYVLNRETGKLTADEENAFKSKPGSGPRHLIIHPNGRVVYLIHELNSTVAVINYDSEKGTFKEIQTIETIPSSFTTNNQCSAIRITPDGKYLYGSNRGHNSIVVYSVEPDTGKLALVDNVSTGGDWPRDFIIDLTGNIMLVANQESNDIFSYRIDHGTGKLTQTGHKIEVNKPVCLLVIPDFAE